MRRPLVFVGSKVGKLRVVRLLTGSRAGHPYVGAFASCVCDCGNAALVAVKHLRGTKTRGKLKRQVSCGCLRQNTTPIRKLASSPWDNRIGGHSVVREPYPPLRIDDFALARRSEA